MPQPHDSTHEQLRAHIHAANMARMQALSAPTLAQVRAAHAEANRHIDAILREARA